MIFLYNYTCKKSLNPSICYGWEYFLILYIFIGYSGKMLPSQHKVLTLLLHAVYKMCKGIQKWCNTEYVHVLSSWTKSVGNKEVWCSSLNIFNIYLQMSRMPCLETTCILWQWNASCQSLLKVNVHTAASRNLALWLKKGLLLCRWVLPISP